MWMVFLRYNVWVRLIGEGGGGDTADYIVKHADSVKDISFLVEDVAGIF